MDNSALIVILCFVAGFGIVACVALFSKVAAAQKLLQEARVKREVAEAELRISDQRVQELNRRNFELQDANSRLEKSAATLVEREKAVSEKFIEFEKFSANAFELARVKFESVNKSQLDVLLTPLKEDLKTFRKRIEDMNAEGERKRGSLEAQIKSLGELNKNLSDEAANLAKALKGGNKTAGNWGELVLERLLERCGLKEGDTFIREDSHTTADGRLRPDFVIKLPEGRNFIVDSKVSLVHYERYVSAETEADAARALKEFIDSVKTHIKGLSAKKYENIEGLENPDFVMIFMPIEAAFSLLVGAEPDVLNFAYENKIALASPSTMLASLKTVETIWRRENQNKNTLKIAQTGGSLYNKVAIFVEKFTKFGKTISILQSDYDEINRTISGKGGVVNLAQNLEQLGAGAKKKINTDALLGDDGESDDV